MIEPACVPFTGSGDEIAGHLSLGTRFRYHADSLARAERSPLCVTIMRAAADDIDAGGTVAELFADIPVPPGAVPTLRLLGAIHYLVLSGRTPKLAAFYPSKGGTMAPDDVWPVVLATLREHFDWTKARLYRTVQTNEPGRATALFAGLLWLTERYRLPIRLLEIGASAGLNLFVDRFCYVVHGVSLGEASSAVRFVEPWATTPDIDLVRAASALRIVERVGCDLAPLDVRDHEDRITLLSYIWPDELERLSRTKAAIELAAQDPSRVVTGRAAAWLSEILPRGRAGELTVVWHSLFRQYVEAEERESLELTFRQAVAESSDRGPVVWLSMEPGDHQRPGIELALKAGYGCEEYRLAYCGDHGPPVCWQ